MQLASSSCALALDPALDVSQYAHTLWKIRDGFTKGVIGSIAQTPDGYLWLGTEFGLYRFDGVRAIPWRPPDGQKLANDYIYSLLVSHDGTLWIGTRAGLASWSGGTLIQYPELTGAAIYSLLADREGTVWAVGEVGGSSDPQPRLCAIRHSQVQCYNESFRYELDSAYEDRKGNLWVGSNTGGLWRWKPGPPQRYGNSSVTRITEDENGALVLAGLQGLHRLVDGKTEKYALPGINAEPTVRLFRSSDGSLWAGTFQGGIVHVHGGRVDRFEQADGLSGNSIWAIFEDREGDIWVGTNEGLDRFRDFAVPTLSGFNATYSLVAANDGSVWSASPGGVSRWRDGRLTTYTASLPNKLSSVSRTAGSGITKAELVGDSGLPEEPESLLQDHVGQIWASTPKGIVRWDGNRFVPVNDVPGKEVYAIVEDPKGTVWFSSSQKGLIRVPRAGVVEQVPWSQLGREDFAITMAADPSQGGLWLGFARGGIAYWIDGQVRASYTTKDGLGKGVVWQLRFGTRGTLWAATEGGLSRVRDGHVATLTSKKGLPCDEVHWSVEDDDHSLWLYMPCGLIRVARSELDAWVVDPTHVLQTTVYDESDGVRLAPALGGFSPKVAKSPDGKIWFKTFGGVSVIDPRHLAFNRQPPPVHIEQITADGKTYDATHGLRLPPLVRDLTVNYTALSLAVPEKVRFRYKLEGQDSEWREVMNDRKVEYSNLRPRNYRFRVMACNNSGVWNEEGAFLDFSIAPAYYQTTWFLVLCVSAFLALLWALYQYRLHQIERQFSIGFEARVSERLRIARELHDTLLQSFQGLLLRFQTASNLFPIRPQEAKQKLDSAIDLAAQAITEGRNAVQGLRASTTVANELAVAIGGLAKELAGNGASQPLPVFRVDVEGEPRDLHPLLRDEVYRIAAEALRNAFRHAQAKSIEAEIHYDPGQLRLRIRDDGKGIARDVIEDDGRTGHWGLHGMRERAKIIGGNLEVWSSAQSGTEVELTIPARVAYATAGQQRSWFSRKGSALKS